MKATSFAALLALTLAGTACSDPAPKQTAAQAPEPTAQVIPASSDADDGFNLPTFDLSTDNTSDDGFNFRMPDLDAADNSDGFNLPSNIPSVSSLDALPDIAVPEIDTAATPTEPDEDEIIRIEP